MNTTDRLRSHLTRQSDALAPAGKGPDAAKAAGSRYRRQRYASVAAVSVVGIALAGFVTVNLGSAPATTDNVAAPSMAPAVLVAGDMNWEAVDVAVGGLGDLYEWEGTYYALSTAPGTVDPGSPTPQALYTSIDGISWDTRPLGDDLWVSDLDHFQGTLYTIGTAPSVGRSVEGNIQAMTAVSHDEGATWTKSDLPVAASPPEGVGSVNYTTSSTQIAAGPRGVVAVVDTRFAMDYSEFIPAEFMHELVSVRRTGEGIEAIDYTAVMEAEMACAEAWESQSPEVPATTSPPTTLGAAPVTTTALVGAPPECQGIQDGSIENVIVFQATWAELGMAEPPRDTFSEIFVSSDGSDWNAVSSSPFQTGSLTHLSATDTGFLGIEMIYPADEIYYTPDAPIWRLWSSPDGRGWEGLSGRFDFSWISSFGAIGDKVVLVGQLGTTGPSTPTVLVSGDGGSSWANMDLSFVFDTEDLEAEWWLSRSHVGPHGLVLSLMASNSERPPAAHVVFTENLADWAEVPLADVEVGTDEFLLTGSIANNGERVLVSLVKIGGGREAQHTVLIGRPR